MRDCGYELVDNPPYSPDLTPSDYKKNHLAGKRYRTDDEVKSAVEDFFEDQDERLYTTGIQALQHRWKKSVDRRRLRRYTKFGEIRPLHINYLAHPRIIR